MKKYWKWKVWLIILPVFLVLGIRGVWAQQSENVDVNGRVPANEYFLPLTLTPSTINTLSQDTNITYTITYGSDLGYAGQLTIEAEWDLATIEGETIPTVDLMHFNDGSATNAYAQTPAVVDKINRTITWVIDSLPAHTTNQTVSFSMNTYFSYMNSGRLTFPVRVRLVNPDVTVPDEIVISSYEYDRNRSAPYSYTGPTPTPTPVVQLALGRIMVKSITENSIELYIITNKDANLTVKYGTELFKYPYKIELSPPSWTTTVKLTDLAPDTTYYVQISAQSRDQTVNSNILKLTTGAIETAPITELVNRESLVFISDYAATFNSTKLDAGLAIPSLVLPQEISYVFAFRVNQPKNIKRVWAMLVDRRILGEMTEAEQQINPNTRAMELPQISPGFYQGRQETPKTTGEYALVAQIFKTDNSISLEPLAYISVSEPIGVFDKSTQEPIEKAQVKLYVKNDQDGGYKPLSSAVFALKNPDYTDTDGNITFVLPNGSYQAEINSLGYKREMAVFEIGTETGKHYPKFYLTAEPFSLASFFYYYWNISLDFVNSTIGHTQSLAKSNRYFQLNAFLVSGVLMMFVFASFRARIRIPIKSMFDYFFHLGRVHLSGKNEGCQVCGNIFDKQTGEKLSGCEVYLLTQQRNTVVGQTFTNKSGNFSFVILPKVKYLLQISKPGYQTIILDEAAIDEHLKNPLAIKMEKINESISTSVKISLFWHQVWDMLFELLLAASLVLEITMTLIWGWQKTMLFLIISSLNLILWLVHLMHKRSAYH